MRYHYWQFLVNQEGQPINAANIKVYLAGSDTVARVYKNEFTTDIIDTLPQAITNGAGYFEFWIGDGEEAQGYDRGQKFKIVWDRPGISYGSIDYIDIFPLVEGVDETDNSSDYKNKLISNSLAYKFNNHVDHDVTESGFPVHGMEVVNINSSDEIFNKIINNYLAKGWEDHKNYEFDSTSPLIDIDNAHNLQPVDRTSDNEIYNKIINNKIATKWEEHVDFDYTSSLSLSASGSAHNLQPIDPYSSNEVYNKLLNNKTAKTWEDHNNYTFSSTLSASLSGDTVHGLDHLDINSSDPTFNKIVSDKIINNIVNDIETNRLNISFNDEDILNLQNKFVNYSITSWTDNGDGTYSNTFTHNLDSEYLTVTCWNTITKKIISPTDIESVDLNNIKITVNDNTLNLYIKLIS